MNDETEPAPIAAIDLGSNSFHLLIGRFISGHFQILGKEKVRVQLAQGLDDNDQLSDEAIVRGLDTLKQFSERLKDIAADDIRIVATYTLRKARNRREFLRQARALLPCPIEVISGSEEARLIYQGVAHTQPGKEHRLVVDIGGGSTECIIGQGFTPLKLNSLDVGCVTFSERFFDASKITNKQFKQAEFAAGRLIAPIASSYKKVSWKQALGCSGTIKAIAYCLEVMTLDSANISDASLQKLKQKFCDDGKVDLKTFTEIASERANVLPSGLAILIALFHELSIDAMQFSEAALREGLVYEMEERMRHHDIRERTAMSLIERYQVDQVQAVRVQTTAVTLYQALKSDWQLNGKKLKPLLNWAALLHEIGISIHFKGFHRHGAYILEHTELPGFNAEEQQLLANLVLKHRKKLSDELPMFTLFEQDDVLKLVLILRLSTLLHLHRSDDLSTPQIHAKDDTLYLSFDGLWLTEHPLLEERLEQEVKEWLKLDKKLVIEAMPTDTIDGV
ncbi:exopolyphosphatase [Corallincola holothuriorum]|uniref:Exopolyphosphatase n=1 Tax=Corallincola holothuriorum TaxID=2282215 RepID=A0A368NEU7_9GAMM|nr:exopolyphosphatase [Corallincola holothuriorum]RCU48736.1 exopolyphosphatase [Corallincola holothuriorum]